MAELGETVAVVSVAVERAAVANFCGRALKI
jgi:hypothetical protein